MEPLRGFASMARRAMPRRFRRCGWPQGQDDRGLGPARQTGPARRWSDQPPVARRPASSMPSSSGSRSRASGWPAAKDFVRSKGVVGRAETEAASRPVHVAIAMPADGTIRLYRDGQPYGNPYTSWCHSVCVELFEARFRGTSLGNGLEEIGEAGHVPARVQPMAALWLGKAVARGPTRWPVSMRFQPRRPGHHVPMVGGRSAAATS